MKTLILNILMLMFITQLNAQHKPETEEKIKAKKIAYLTEALKFTPEEAQKFWPVYNQKEDEQKELRKQMRDIHKDKKIEDMTDTEAEKMMEQMLSLRQKELDLDKKYVAKFKEVLPVKKVAMLHKFEMEFRREMLKEMREHKHEHHQNKRQEKK